MLIALTAPVMAQSSPAGQQSTNPQNSGSGEQPQVRIERQPAGDRRIPQSQAPRGAGLLGLVETADGRPLGGTQVAISGTGGAVLRGEATGDGIFRVGGIPAGVYTLKFMLPGYEEVSVPNVQLNASEILTVEVQLKARADAAKSKSGRELPRYPGEAGGTEQASSYRELSRRPYATGETTYEDPLAVPESKVAQIEADRWNIELPTWERFPERAGNYPYTQGRWWDPYNRNKLKADYPIIGQQIFLGITGNLTTGMDFRRLYVPSGPSAAGPGRQEFFGDAGQAFIASTLRVTFDLFKGNTAYRPIDWRVRFTPAVQINQIWTKQRGIVNIDVRKGTDRTDWHAGLQEAFVEAKLRDLSPNYDTVSVRAGIQQFTSDFRGFIMAVEQPGFRVFGNLYSNRLQYNAAYFYFLEKDTNSGLNTFQKRNQQVIVGNAYYQDFLTKGYTASVSYHYNKDDADIHFDENGFLVRPAPIGFVVDGGVRPHDIRTHYIGITGNGHKGRINISNAFYQVLGYDTYQPFARKRTEVNAQLAALELSIDKDWVRPRVSVLYSSGDKNPTDRIARGFDTIQEAQAFNGGIFSFFNREGIRLTGSGVGLIAPESLIPNLKSSKEEGQASYVNPGLFQVSAGVDLDITPSIKFVNNVNWMQFMHTEPLELLLFQRGIKRNIGVDIGTGVVYRPRVSENITIATIY